MADQVTFTAELQDNVSPNLEKLEKQLKQAGMQPIQIKMVLEATDQATPKIKEARKQMASLPDRHTFHIDIKGGFEKLKMDLRRAKEEITKPIAMPFKLVDQQGQDLSGSINRLQQARNQLAFPIMQGASGVTNLVPGSGSLVGGALGGGAMIGALTGVTSALEDSIKQNVELQQAHQKLTIALRDQSGATTEVNKVIAANVRSPYTFQQTLQADVLGRAYQLPVFKGENKKVPGGYLQMASNMAAAMGSTPDDAMMALAMARQHQFRRLQLFGIRMTREDFGAGGRFAGMSIDQALQISAGRRYAGSMQAQLQTFPGMMSNIKDVVNAQIMRPIGQNVFQALSSHVGGVEQSLQTDSTKKKIGELVQKFQEFTQKAMDSLQKVKEYFDVYLKKPLSDIVSAIKTLGASFAQAFGGTAGMAIHTFAEAVISIVDPLASLTKNMSVLGVNLGTVMGYMRGFQMVGLGGMVRPLQTLFNAFNPQSGQGFFSGLIKGVAGLPSMMLKLGGFLALKEIIDAHKATQNLNDQFQDMPNKLAQINSQASELSMNFAKSEASVKNLMALVANGLPSERFATPQDRETRARQETRSVLAIAQHTGLSTTDVANALNNQMKKSQDYSASALQKFSDQLVTAAAVAKTFGDSWSSVIATMNTFAKQAGPVGMGGLAGLPPLLALSHGVNKYGVTSNQIAQGYYTPNSVLQTMMGQYSQPTLAGLRSVAPGHLGDYWNFKYNPAAVQKGGQNEAIFERQARAGVALQSQARAGISQMAPTALGSGPDQIQSLPNLWFTQHLNTNFSQFAMGRPLGLQGIQTQSPEQIAEKVKAAWAATSDAYQKAVQEISTYNAKVDQIQNTLDQYNQAQAAVNLQVQAFQHRIQLQQRAVEDAQLTLSEYTLNNLAPLEKALSAVQNQLDIVNHTMTNSQYNMTKFADGLLTGEQAALNQLHALQLYNEQLNYLKLQYTQIGAQLGTHVYERGYSSVVQPMMGLSLEMQMQQNQRREELAQARYNITYGEGHYKMQQAQRSVFQRTEMPLNQRLKGIREAQALIDQSTIAQHNLGNIQFQLQEKMYHVNRVIQDQQNHIQALTNKVTALNQSKQMRMLQDEQYNLGQKIGETNIQLTRQQKILAQWQNTLDNLNQKKQDLQNVFDALINIDPAAKFDNARHMVMYASRMGLLPGGHMEDIRGLGGRIVGQKFVPGREAQGILAQIDKAQKAAQRSHPGKDWRTDRASWINIIAEGIKGFFTGDLFRKLGDRVGGLPGTALRMIGNAVPFAGLGLVGAAGLTAGSVALRRLARGALNHLPGEAAVIREMPLSLTGIRAGFAKIRGNEARAAELLSKAPDAARTIGEWLDTKFRTMLWERMKLLLHPLKGLTGILYRVIGGAIGFTLTGGSPIGGFLGQMGGARVHQARIAKKERLKEARKGATETVFNRTVTAEDEAAQAAADARSVVYGHTEGVPRESVPKLSRKELRAMEDARDVVYGHYRPTPASLRRLSVIERDSAGTAKQLLGTITKPLIVALEDGKRAGLGAMASILGTNDENSIFSKLSSKITDAISGINASVPDATTAGPGPEVASAEKSFIQGLKDNVRQRVQNLRQFVGGANTVAKAGREQQKASEEALKASGIVRDGAKEERAAGGIFRRFTGFFGDHIKGFGKFTGRFGIAAGLIDLIPGKLGDKIRDFAKGVGDFIKNGVESFVKGAGNLIKNGFDEFKNTVKDVFKPAVWLFKTIGEGIVKIINKIPGVHVGPSISKIAKEAGAAGEDSRAITRLKAYLKGNPAAETALRKAASLGENVVRYGGKLLKVAGWAGGALSFAPAIVDAAKGKWVQGGGQALNALSWFLPGTMQAQVASALGRALGLNVGGRNTAIGAFNYATTHPGNPIPGYDPSGGFGGVNVSGGLTPAEKATLARENRMAGSGPVGRGGGYAAGTTSGQSGPLGSNYSYYTDSKEFDLFNKQGKKILALKLKNMQQGLDLVKQFNALNAKEMSTFNDETFKQQQSAFQAAIKGPHGLEDYLDASAKGLQSYHNAVGKMVGSALDNQNKTTSGGFKNIADTTNSWLKALTKTINAWEKSNGLSITTKGGGGAAAVGAVAGGALAAGTTVAGIVGNFIQGFESGGIIKADKHKIGPGRLIRAVEEGYDEMVIPLAPHRRDKAKQLVAQAHAKIGGYAAGGYVNPFQGDTGISPERIDMGVDYSAPAGTPIRAIGDAQVINAASGGTGWTSPTNTQAGVVYRLLKGRYAGRSIFVTEDIAPTVKTGEMVKSGQVIANFLSSSTGIETGWATGIGYQSLAAALHQENPNGDPGAWSTAAGASFSNFIVSLGGPAGILTPGGIHGTMPRRYPTFKGAGAVGSQIVPPPKLPDPPDSLKSDGIIGPHQHDILQKNKKKWLDGLTRLGQAGKGAVGAQAAAGIYHLGATPAGGYTPTTWAKALLRGLGYKTTNQSLQDILAWEQQEGGNWNNAAKFNPLNTTETMPGSFNPGFSAGVQAYRSWTQGLEATIKTLKNGSYGGILSSLQQSSALSAFEAAVNSSPWGTVFAGGGTISSGGGGGYIPTKEAKQLWRQGQIDLGIVNPMHKSATASKASTTGTTVGSAKSAFEVMASSEDTGGTGAFGFSPGPSGYSILSLSGLTGDSSASSVGHALGPNAPWQPPSWLWVKYGNKKAKASLQDKGAGDSSAPTIGLYQDTRAALGMPYGDYKVQIERADGHPFTALRSSAVKAFAGGISRVPQDDYQATLHRDEMVVPAAIAHAARMMAGHGHGQHKTVGTDALRPRHHRHHHHRLRDDEAWIRYADEIHKQHSSVGNIEYDIHHIKKYVENKLNEKPTSSNEAKALKMLNEDLRKHYRRLYSAEHHYNRALRRSLWKAGDKSGGENTAAGVSDERARRKRSAHNIGEIRHLVHQLHRIHHREHHLKHRIAHEKGHKRHHDERKLHQLEHHAKHIRHHLHHLRNEKGPASHANAHYIVGAAVRGVNAGLLRSIVGFGLNKHQMHLYREVAKIAAHHPHSRRAHHLEHKLLQSVIHGHHANSKHHHKNDHHHNKHHQHHAKHQHHWHKHETHMNKTEKHQTKVETMLSQLVAKDTVINLTASVKGSNIIVNRKATGARAR